MTTRVREHESQYRDMPCAAPGCGAARVKAGQHKASRYSPFCAQHHAEALARRAVEDALRQVASCTLAQLDERWTTHPYGALALLDGRAVLGLKRLEHADAYRVTLSGLDASTVMRAETVVTLGRHAPEPAEAEWV